jgi:hypothetical protein
VNSVFTPLPEPRGTAAVTAKRAATVALAMAAARPGVGWREPIRHAGRDLRLLALAIEDGQQGKRARRSAATPARLRA